MRYKGQSSIEFIIVFGFSLGFLVIFISMGINHTLGYLVHYGTYEASRVYLVNDRATQNIASSESYAVDLIPRIKAVRSFTWEQIFSQPIFRMEEASGFQVNRPGNVIPEFVGIYYKYKRKLSDSGFLTGEQKVDYTSESFLGKEPVRAECLERICESMGGACGGIEVTAFDNGC